MCWIRRRATTARLSVSGRPYGSLKPSERYRLSRILVSMGEKMLIRNEFAIEFNMPRDAAMIGLLRLHPSLDARVRFPEMLNVEHLDDAGDLTEVRIDEYLDTYGNRCSRFLAPAGHLKITGEGLVECDAVPDPIASEAKQHPVEEL